jgi:hypothetical protein
VDELAIEIRYSASPSPKYTGIRVRDVTDTYKIKQMCDYFNCGKAKDPAFIVTIDPSFLSASDLNLARQL